MKYLSLEVPLGDVSILYNILTKEYSPRNHSMEGGRGEVRGGEIPAKMLINLT